MNSSQRLRAFVAGLAVVAAGSLLLPAGWAGPWGDWLPVTAVFAAVGLLLEFVEVPTQNNGTLSVSGVAHVAIALVAPAPFGAIAVGGAVLIHQLVLRRPPIKVAFNVANHVLTISLATFIAGLFGAPPVTLTVGAIPVGYVAALSAALTYYLVNVTLTAAIVSLASGRRFWYIVRSNNRGTILPDLGASTLGVLLAAGWYAMPSWLALLGVPTAVIARTLRIIRRLERETVEAVETLADAIDERDPTTYHHSARVSEYAVALAEAIEVDDALVDLVRTAARVHDLGKMGVTDAVLMKPAVLDDEERRRIREHPEIGARILGRYGLYKDGVELVRAHHERWDGSGYPSGLAGDRIPLGARIIAVADGFDAMTSDRPYRVGMHPLMAIEELRRGAGGQWDPVIVGHFARLLTDPLANLPDTPAVRRLREPIPRPVLVDLALGTADVPIVGGPAVGGSMVIGPAAAEAS